MKQPEPVDISEVPRDPEHCVAEHCVATCLHYVAQCDEDGRLLHEPRHCVVCHGDPEDRI